MNRKQIIGALLLLVLIFWCYGRDESPAGAATKSRVAQKVDEDIRGASDPNEPTDPNSVDITPPVLPVIEPRQIVMPGGARLPMPDFKCSRHGEIGKNVLVLEHEQKKAVYCRKCALKFVIDVFDLNIPRAEIVK